MYTFISDAVQYIQMSAKPKVLSLRGDEFDVTDLSAWSDKALMTDRTVIGVYDFEIKLAEVIHDADFVIDRLQPGYRGYRG